MTASAFLTGINLLGAVIGFLTGAYTARALGPERLGVVAVIGAVNASILAFLDVRLSDVIGRMYYDEGAAAPPSFRAGVLWAGILGTAAVSAAMVLLSVLFTSLAVPLFTDAPVRGWWIAASAVSSALASLAGVAWYLMRLSQDFYVLGGWRLAGSATGAAVMIGVLSRRPDMDVFFAAGVAASAAVALVAAGAWAHIWRRAGVTLLRADLRGAWAAGRRHWRMIWYGNLLGYAKVLQRSADVLFVALFAGDRETGLYRLSRQVIDQGLAIFQGGLNEVHLPLFQEYVAKGDSDGFVREARKLMAWAGGMTLLFLAGGALLLPRGVPLLFGPGYEGVHVPMLLLTATFFYLVGFHPWLWAGFIGTGEMRGYTRAIFASVVVQYATMLLLFHVSGPSAAAAMAGMLAAHVFMAPAACAELGRVRKDLLPWRARP